MASVCFGLSGKTTEVLGAYLLPFAGIDELGGEAVVHLLPTLGVDVGFGLFPGGDEVYHFIDSTLVAEIQFVDECTATLHLMRPRYVVEPEEVLLGTSGQIVIQSAVWFGILQCGTTALGGAVEAYALFVSSMVIDGTPFERIAGDETVRLGAVVVVKLKYMMQADGHHVVHTGFATTEHHVEQ